MRIEVEKAGAVTEHEANLLVPILSEGSILVQLLGDRRPISQIAADFDGADEIRTDDGRRFSEYTELIVVYRVNADTVQVRIRPAGGE